MTAPRSRKQERECLARGLRAQGKTWVEVADVIRMRYRLNARVALRLARGWSQSQAAAEWNGRWPDDPKTLKTFSYWELWPASTGHAPSFDSLGKLAELYECSVSFLLIDLPDYQHRDSAHQALSAASDSAAQPSGEIALFDHAETLFLDLLGPSMRTDGAGAGLTLPSPFDALGWRLSEIDCNELAQVFVMWLQRLNPALNRRELLTRLSAAITLAAVTPLFDIADADERRRVARTLVDPSRFDEPALRYCETVIGNLRRQGDILGPRLTLQSVMGHRQTAAHLVDQAPSTFRERALSAYAELTQLVGWLCFNMGDYRAAAHYYDEARTAAHDARNIELVTYVLCTMSQLATWQGKPRVGIDHAAAAAVWAEQSNSPHARAYAADVAVRAFAADHQPDKCREKLDQEYAALRAFQPDEPMSSWWYFYDESFYLCTEGECALVLDRPDEAMHTIEKSLALVDHTNVHNYSFHLLLQAEAHLQQGAIPEASRIIGDVAGLTAVSTPPRVDQRITTLRTGLNKWQRTKAVRELDDRLAAYRRSAVSGNGSTIRTYSR